MRKLVLAAMVGTTVVVPRGSVVVKPVDARREEMVLRLLAASDPVGVCYHHAGLGQRTLCYRGAADAAVEAADALIARLEER